MGLILTEIVATSHDWEEVSTRCVDELGEDLTQNAVSKRLRASGGSYRALLGSRCGDPIAHAKTRQKLAQARQSLRQIQARALRLETSLELVQQVPEYTASLEPFRNKKPGRRRAAHVLMVSDTHIEETVDPATVNGRNEYNLAIAKSRFRRIWEGQVYLSQYHRQVFDLDGVVWLGGDLITNYLHEELQEQNSLSPQEAILAVREWIIDGLELLRAEGGYGRIKVVCSYGNHGRTHAKPRISTAAANNLEYMLYCLLAHDYAQEKDVEFVVEKGHLTYQDIYGTKVRFTHGDAIKGGGGVSGPYASVARKIAQWDRVDRADVTVMGHLHRFTMGDNFLINGSAIGYAPFGIWIAAACEPPQQGSFLIDETRGRAMVTPIWLDEKTEGVL